MKSKNLQLIYLFLLFIFVDYARCICVLESDFGFSINCNFKKSGLFRVRNLGGVKAHIGLGFSLGDELGFPESLGNLEGSRRRALNHKTGANTNSVLRSSPTIRSTIQQSTPQAVTSNYQMLQLSNNLQPKILPPRAFQKPIAMTQATTLPLGVPKFKPIPQDNNLQVEAESILNEQISGYKPIQYQSDKALSSSSGASLVDLKGYTVEELAAFANVSVDVIKSAIKLREQQMIKENMQRRKKTPSIHATTSVTKERIPSSTSLPTTATHVVRKRIYSKKSNKVMNAPKEYYPNGYDKDFDDNFKSKVDLPATSFTCSDQKHFPGLYADQDLGCMVFHVCALTDDGLIMKSFLCPENTLFDQSILKCNWWFYTDCNSSKTLYDSNLPVSKSYQLMKSLAFFNANYKKSTNLTEVLDTNLIDSKINP